MQQFVQCCVHDETCCCEMFMKANSGKTTFNWYSIYISTYEYVVKNTFEGCTQGELASRARFVYWCWPQFYKEVCQRNI